MGLLKMIGNTRFGYKGLTPNPMMSALFQSKLHNQYSISGKPNISNKPQPSQLDLQGETPNQYIQNLPN